MTRVTVPTHAYISTSDVAAAWIDQVHAVTADAALNN
jgi:hypothetical protein